VAQTEQPEIDKVRFEALVLVHLDSAYNLARGLVRGGEHDAHDVVQEAFLRAYRGFAGLRGAGDARSWLLAIVRNTCRTWLDRNRRGGPAALTDEDLDQAGDDDGAGDPQRLMLRRADAAGVRAAVESLPPEFREVIVLRELEGLSYKEVAAVAGVPIGTVMSRLARARRRLEVLLCPQFREEV
jgi:RNA polymerase sigma-70 factor (ECF subfamily)